MLFLACTAAFKETTFPEGWTAAEPSSCSRKQGASWRDVSARIPYQEMEQPPEGIRVSPEPGGVVLAPHPEGWQLAWTRGVDSSVDSVLDSDLAVEREFHGDPTAGFVLEDFDGDGVLDLLSFGVGQALLSWSWGYPEQEDVSLDIPLFPVVPRFLREIAAGDFDGDGKSDLFVFYAPLAPDIPPSGAILWNLGSRQFSEEEEIKDVTWGFTFDAQVVDTDLDNDLDIFLCHDGGDIPHILLKNEGGHFKKQTPAGLEIHAYCMGIGVGDLNQDGMADLYLSDLQRHYLMSSHQGDYLESASAWGLPDQGVLQMGWGALLEDLDNDGLLDLAVATSDFYVANPGLWPLWMFNQQEDTLKEIGKELGFPQTASTRGLILRDINEDGILDVISGDTWRSPWIFESEGCTENNYLEVQAPTGSRVQVEAEGQQWTAWALAESSWASAAPAVAHMGLGKVQVVDRLRLWVPGQEEVVVEGPFEARRRLKWADAAP